MFRASRAAPEHGVDAGIIGDHFLQADIDAPAVLGHTITAPDFTDRVADDA
jgi:hypothetical protein